MTDMRDLTGRNVHDKDVVNHLSTDKRAQIVSCSCEGMSIRATVCVTEAAKNTITKLFAELGGACAEYQHAALFDLPCTDIQCDEIWSFCYAKRKNVPEEHRDEFVYCDVSTWTAICADTKIGPSWLVGERTAEDAEVSYGTCHFGLPTASSSPPVAYSSTYTPWRTPFTATSTTPNSTRSMRPPTLLTMSAATARRLHRDRRSEGQR
jgi:hypothetical protein